MEEQDAVDQAMRVGLRSAEFMEWGLDYARRNQKLHTAVVFADLDPFWSTMHPLTRPFAVALICAALTTSLSAQSQTKPIDPANLDTTCAPCKNFFQYANGGWLKRSEIPGDQPRWGSFNELQEQNYAALKDVLTDAATSASSTKDPNLRKLGTFYGTCMDSTGIETAGIRPLQPELDRISAIRDRHGIEAAITRLHQLGIPAGFTFRSVPDAKKSSRTIAETYQGGLGMPDRDYYTKSDSASEKIQAEYVQHVARMLQLAGEDRHRGTLGQGHHAGGDRAGQGLHDPGGAARSRSDLPSHHLRRPPEDHPRVRLEPVSERTGAQGHQGGQRRPARVHDRRSIRC